MHQKAFSYASRCLIRQCMPPQWEKEMTACICCSKKNTLQKTNMIIVKQNKIKKLSIKRINKFTIGQTCGLKKFSLYSNVITRVKKQMY